ncbi:unnamed protein product [Macrosiphum euphorbiae]|uniref:Uncharacterized protein n=1 Tax=Macrosiphum euphorbiae TaxID=13131 RepID=A0AAV0VJ74_9HEMI|nr:unnamed protein product [Macrosiphum euphorbiae]
MTRGLSNKSKPYIIWIHSSYYRVMEHWTNLLSQKPINTFIKSRTDRFKTFRFGPPGQLSATWWPDELGLSTPYSTIWNNQPFSGFG